MASKGYDDEKSDRTQEHRYERSDANEKTEKRLRSTVSPESQQALNQHLLEKKAGSRFTVGGGQFAVLDQRNCPNDTTVTLKNRLPEAIQTGRQSWERDAKDPQKWHVQEGNHQFELKAEVKFQEGKKFDTLSARVSYENGREVTYKNGQADQIKHPSGELWKADPKNKGSWDVFSPNKEDPEHPHHSKISNVRVDLASGDIKWQVKSKDGGLESREITADKKYIAEHRNTDKNQHNELEHKQAEKKVEAEKRESQENQDSKLAKVLEKTKEGFDAALKGDRSWSPAEAKQIMRTLNQSLDAMPQKEKEQFLAGLKHMAASYEKEHGMPLRIMADANDPGKIYAMQIGDRSYINMGEDKAHGAKVYPAELVTASHANKAESKILKSPDDFNCHRTTMELAGQGDAMLRQISKGATQLNQLDLKSSGFERVKLNSIADLKAGDIVAIKAKLGDLINPLAYSHSGTVSMQDGKAVITQKVGSEAKEPDRFLVRQDAADFAGKWTGNEDFTHNAQIEVYRRKAETPVAAKDSTESKPREFKLKLAGPEMQEMHRTEAKKEIARGSLLNEPGHANPRELVLKALESVSRPSMAIPAVEAKRSPLLNRLLRREHQSRDEHSDSRDRQSTSSVLLSRLRQTPIEHHAGHGSGSDSGSGYASRQPVEHQAAHGSGSGSGYAFRQPVEHHAAHGSGSGSGYASRQRLEHQASHEQTTGKTDVTNMLHVMASQARSFLGTGIDFRNTRRDFRTDRDASPISYGLKTELPYAGFKRYSKQDR